MHSGQYTIHVEPVHILPGHIPGISQLYIYILKGRICKIHSGLLLAYATVGSKQVQVIYMHFLII